MEQLLIFLTLFLCFLSSYLSLLLSPFNLAMFMIMVSLSLASTEEISVFPISHVLRWMTFFPSSLSLRFMWCFTYKTTFFLDSVIASEMTSWISFSLVRCYQEFSARRWYVIEHVRTMFACVFYFCVGKCAIKLFMNGYFETTRRQNISEISALIEAFERGRSPMATGRLRVDSST